MRERSILFNGPMVRAILEGRKTMTRRVCPYILNIATNEVVGARWFNELKEWHLINNKDIGVGRWDVKCPYGQSGDRLWVRETFFEQADPDTSVPYTPPRYSYRATYDYENYSDPFVDDGDGGITWNKDGTIKSPWRPSIHMPRWASRLLLEVTSVRVERVQDITHNDALREGVSYDLSKQDGSPIDRFRLLWNSINAKRGCGWDANPWVWVVEFKVLSKG
jgi:hypothetical protein